MTLYIYIVYYYLILYIKKGRFGESNLKDRFHIKLRVRMDKKQIVKQASQLKSKEDLLNLLNRIKRDEIEEMGFGSFPVCMAKNQYSLSDDPKKLGRPEGFDINIREVYVSAGAGFVVAITGTIMTMPGLPKKPAAYGIDVNDEGVITGLF